MRARKAHKIRVCVPQQMRERCSMYMCAVLRAYMLVTLDFHRMRELIHKSNYCIYTFLCIRAL